MSPCKKNIKTKLIFVCSLCSLIWCIFFLSPITTKIFRSHFKEFHLVNQTDFKPTFLDWPLVIVKFAKSNKKKKDYSRMFYELSLKCIYLKFTHLNRSVLIATRFEVISNTPEDVTQKKLKRNEEKVIYLFVYWQRVRHHVKFFRKILEYRRTFPLLILKEPLTLRAYPVIKIRSKCY